VPKYRPQTLYTFQTSQNIKLERVFGKCWANLLRLLASIQQPLFEKRINVSARWCRLRFQY
jgi:hypothetical protein